jgi:hypothetical protein
MEKFSWAITAGDQIGDSEDDQPCGDHFIDKDLECHEGDAHRPTPGKNPYWQGDRKGPEDKSKTPEKKSGEKNQPGHKRDRSEHTKQNRERMEYLLDQGHTPESLGRDNVNHFADLMEKSYGRPLTDKDIHTLVDMVNQKMGENFSQDPEQKGIHDSTAPKGFKGPKGREMSRPDSYHKETTDKEYAPSNRGGPEGGGLYDHYKNILKDRIKDGGKQAESALASKLTWGKIMQDRVEDQRKQERDDMAQARPCEEGEDPKIGKCNPNTSPERGGQMRPPTQKSTSPAGDISDQYRLSDSDKQFKRTPKEGIGLQPAKDAGREGRMAQHVDFLSQDDGINPTATTNLMSKMMGGAKPQPQPDGSSMVGSRAATPQQAKQQNDDYRDTLTKSGWENHSDMGPISSWKKGNVAVVLKQTKNGNQMKVKGLQRQAAPAPKKKGFFR